MVFDPGQRGGRSSAAAVAAAAAAARRKRAAGRAAGEHAARTAKHAPYNPVEDAALQAWVDSVLPSTAGQGLPALGAFSPEAPRRAATVQGTVPGANRGFDPGYGAVSDPLSHLSLSGLGGSGNLAVSDPLSHLSLEGLEEMLNGGPAPVAEKTPQQHADEYLTMLSKMDTDEDRIQFALNPMGDGSVAGFLSEDAATMLRDGQGGLGEPAATSRFAWEGGKIVPKGDGSKTETETTETETTETETETPQVEECGVGEVRNAAGQCVPIAQATPDDACPAGQVRDANGECVSVYTAPTDAADPEGTIETLSANPREIAKTRLDDTKTAITSMLNSGLLDIKTAQELYDTETERVWKDFLSTQNAVRSDFRNVADAQRAQRYDDRMALEEQMRAAGVNPGLVGDRFAMIDAVAGAGADERGAYLDDLGLVSQMADADRKFMGEGIFGGYKQDLRSRANELGYGAEVDRIGADYDARSQALQAADLAPFLGLDPRAVAAGLASGVDIPGLSTAVSEAALDRALTVSEGGLDRGVSQQRADTEADRLAEQIRQFDVGIDPATGLPYGFDPATGLDAGQTATLTAQGIDPLTGRPYGFDTATGLTAADKLSAQQFADQLESTEGMATDKLDFAKLGLDLDWWEARGDQAAGVMDRQLEKNQFELLEDKFALVEDQFAWDQAMDIAELGDQDFNLGTQLSLHAGSIEGGAAIMQEVADYMYNNNINAANTGYAHALAALDYGPVLTFLYTQQFMEDGTPQDVAEPLAEAAVDALEETGGASTEPVIGAADRAKTGSPPISATERTRVNVGANPPAGVRTVDNDELLRPMENYYQDAEGNYYSEDWKAPEAPDPGSNPRFDPVSGLQYVTNNDGLIIKAPDTAAAREAGLVVGQMDPNRTSTARTGIVQDRTSTVPQ